MIDSGPKSCHMMRGLLFVLAALLPGVAHPQTETASIWGAVTDASGAVVPGAALRLVNSDRGIASGVTTGNDGSYTFAGLYPGEYRLEVEKSGFKSIRTTAITVYVLDSLERDFRLEVGSATETVHVEAKGAAMNTTDGAVSTVVERQLIDNLPLNGRSFQTLIMLAPGVVVTPTAFDDQGQFSVNGQRADGNYFTIDGVSANFGVTGYGPLVQAAGGALPALSAQGGTNSLVSVDAMQEFRVQTSSFAPEFGRTPGGQISIVTRSGTNAFHGTAFDYLRNSDLDANDWFANYNHLAKPAERQNDFGGVFGGPLLRDKTFFFFSYEGLRLRLPSTEETVVPDTSSRQQAQATEPSVLPYLNIFPVANGAELGGGFAQFNATYVNPASLDATSIRIDHALSSRITLFGRYNYSPSNVTQRGALPPPNAVLSTLQTNSSTIHTFTIGSSQLIRPTLSNEVRANYSNQKVSGSYVIDDFGGAIPLSNEVMFLPGYSPSNANFEFDIVGAGKLEHGKNATDEQRQINFIDEASLARGNHQLKFGVDYRWQSPICSPSIYAQFSEFTSMGKAAGGALSGTAAVAYTYGREDDTLLSHNVSLYGQDTWRITPRLNLAYGLRWDINPPLKGKTLANQPFTVTGLDNPSTIALAPRGTPLYQTTYGNVAPRIGLAFRLRDSAATQTVLRGGFGVFYDLGYGSLGGASSYFPFQNIKTLRNVPFPLSTANALPPTLSTSPPVTDLIVADPNLKLPRTYEWNAAIEQELGANQSFSVTYIGASGRYLLRNTALLSPNANFAFVDLADNSATSNYQALQVKFERHLARDLQGVASYTWAHSIDIASTDAFATYLNTPAFLADPNVDRGNSDFDIRNSFTAGVTYSPPRPPSGRVVKAIFGGWSFDAFVLARSAPPVDLVGAMVAAAGTVLYPRPNVVPGVPQVLFGSQYPGGKIFNKAAFKSPPPGTQGNLGRNVLRGFGAFQGDFAVQRQFGITEKLRLNFRSEFFNVFNHPNFGPPTNSLTSPLFGYSTQTLANSLAGSNNAGFNPLYQIGGPRSIQLAAKLQF